MRPQITTITPERQLDDLAANVIRLTSPHPLHGNLRHAGTKREIADAARKLAESVELYLAGMLQPVTIDERIPF